MKNQEDCNKELKNRIDMCFNGWCGDLAEFTSFVETALTKHLYDVMNAEDTRFKPTFDEWENLVVNKNNLIEMLDRTRELQVNNDFRLVMFSENA